MKSQIETVTVPAELIPATVRPEEVPAYVTARVRRYLKSFKAKLNRSRSHGPSRG